MNKRKQEKLEGPEFPALDLSEASDINMRRVFSYPLPLSVKILTLFYFSYF